MLNLIDDRWLPVARRSGATDTLRPSDLTNGYADDPITALAFPRPDWNAAVTELLVGLHAVAMPVAGPKQWLALWDEPPAPEVVAEAMAPFVPAFALMGEGARCFQDADTLADAKPVPIQQLLIDAPGGNTAKLNQDLFTRRRGEGYALAWGHAAAALVTLQTYAPSGGAGHRTSMRGGGPLTTLVRPRREGAGDAPVPLYNVVLANAPRGVPAPAPDDPSAFPWLASARTSRKGEPPVTPEDAHPLQAFFATPRRLRLMGGEGGATAFRTVPYGANYEGWAHPLSPYYDDKGTWRPLHPREGVPTFRDWPGLWGAGDDKRAAACVSAFGAITARADDVRGGMVAMGYDMDNMKARAWMEARPPLVLDDAVRARADCMVRAAGEAAGALRLAAKRALYGQLRQKDGGAELYLPDTVPKRACTDLAGELELTTEPVLRGMIESLRGAGDEAADALAFAWHTELRGTTLRLFDRTVGIRSLGADELFRVVRARGALGAAFGVKGSVSKTLQVTERLRARRKKAA